MAEYADSPLHEALGVRFTVAPTPAEKTDSFMIIGHNHRICKPQQSQLDPTWLESGCMLWLLFWGLGFMSSFFLVNLAYFELTFSLRRLPKLSIEL